MGVIAVFLSVEILIIDSKEALMGSLEGMRRCYDPEYQLFGLTVSFFHGIPYNVSGIL